jgi:tetratricopeptide (TPR) repeat protein
MHTPLRLVLITASFYWLSGCHTMYSELHDAYSAGRYDEVISLAEKAGAEFPRSASAAELVANAYLKKGEVDVAKKWFEYCAQVDLAGYAQSVDCYLYAARIDSERGNIDEALKNFRRARDMLKLGIAQRLWTRTGEQRLAALESELQVALDEQRRRQQPAPMATTAPQQEKESTRLELAFWDSIKTSSNSADFVAYLQKFPNGTFAELARARLGSLGEAPVRPTPLAIPAAGTIDFGRSHALVIGINRYRQITPLKTAVNDAKTVADILRKEYAFQVSLLIDPTRNEILDAFDDLRRTLHETDNLLIYYAGHGHLDTDSDRGFWLPVDAHKDRRSNWLSNADIADMVRATRAKHVLLVADSCYAGTLTRSLSVQLSGLDDFSRLAQKRARTALVSGGLEPVEDAGGGNHSVFAKAFLDQLRANTGIVDMSQIFSAMRRQVILSAQQTPRYADIRQAGHEGGDFIFVRKAR